MEILYYTWEVICQAWPVILLMGMIAVPIMWIFHNESKEEFEKLDKYYNSLDYQDINKDDICDN